MAFDVARQNSNGTSFTFKWILENFPYCCQKEDHVLVSPSFIVDTMERTKWRLELCPRKTIQSEAYIALFLRREEDSKGPPNFKVAFEFSLLTSNGSALKTKYSDEIDFYKSSYWGFNDYVERKSVFAQRSTYMPQESLTVQCRMWKNVNNRIRGHCIARTHIAVERKTFHWKIEKFSLFDIHQEACLTVKSTSGSRKIMTLVFSFGKRPTNDDFFVFFRNLNQSIVFSTFKASLLNTQGDLLDCGTSEIVFPHSEFDSRYKIPLSKSRLIDDKYLYLPNNVLTLYCELAYSTGDVYKGILETKDECPGFSITNNIETANIKCSDYTDLKMDLSTMLQNSIHCDVKLCVESQTFQAHWFVLMARSPAFRAMYESEMTKSQIHIKNLRPEIFRCMLHYLYTDEVEELNWKVASELYIAAFDYVILPLMDKCSSFLKNNLDLENACQLLLLPNLNNDVELKAAVQSFILKNDKIIFKSSEWKLFMEANVNLALETMMLKYEE